MLIHLLFLHIKIYITVIVVIMEFNKEKYYLKLD